MKRKPPNFYSRPCGRGDAAALVCNRQIPFYFYSRPCGRGDVFFQREEAVFHISTHAPAGGATSRIYYVDAASYISTHAPAGGATVAFAMARTVQSPFLLTPLREGRHRKHAIFDRKLDFYSRPCGRGDASRKWSAPLPILISTHAPAGGATISNNGSSELVVFLLTPLREGRPKPFAIAMLVPYFYSRPCGRGDQCEGTPLFFATYFYSRPCGRGDGGRPESEKANAFISTHAPAGGATVVATFCCHVLYCISTHAPAGGATYGWHISNLRIYISTHAPAGGATSPAYFFIPAPMYFYSRPCGRGDQYIGFYLLIVFQFLLTPLREGRLLTKQGKFLDFDKFLLTPLREGRPVKHRVCRSPDLFLLTPLREGRRHGECVEYTRWRISTHAPAGGATQKSFS